MLGFTTQPCRQIVINSNFFAERKPNIPSFAPIIDTSGYGSIHSQLQQAISLLITVTTNLEQIVKLNLGGHLPLILDSKILQEKHDLHFS